LSRRRRGGFYVLVSSLPSNGGWKGVGLRLEAVTEDVGKGVLTQLATQLERLCLWLGLVTAQKPDTYVPRR
jgi:hypothetical protein